LRLDISDKEGRLVERDVTMVIKIPAEQLVNFRIFTVTHGGEIMDTRSEEEKKEHHPIKTKEEYVRIYEERKERVEGFFDDTATAEEIAGYFIYHEGDGARRSLRECIDENSSAVEIEALGILEILCGEQDVQEA
jgi:hypothetical protein